MKKFAALTFALMTATSATAAPLTLNAPQTGDKAYTVIQVGGPEAQAIKEKYKAKFEQLRAEMKAEMEALRSKRQATKEQRKANKPPKAAKANKPPKAEKQS